MSKFWQKDYESVIEPMYTQITDNIYSIYVNMPKSPLKNLNAYLIKDKDRNLLIDTGYRMRACRESLLEGLRELDVNMDNTDIFLTHFHPDHTGLVPDIVGKDSKVFMSKIDTWRQGFSSTPNIHEINYKVQHENGFTDQHIADNPNKDNNRLGPEGFTDFISFEEGQIFNYGGHELKAIATPGHTPGHMILFDEKNKILFLGDHVLFGITPNIQRWLYVPDSLGDYIQSLLKVRDFDAQILLPAHRTTKGSLSKRVDEIIEHHGVRVRETVDVIEKYPGSTAYQLASHMSWNIRYNGDWEAFPMQQRVFAVGETRAHLEYLLLRNRAKCEAVDGVLYYYPEN